MRQQCGFPALKENTLLDASTANHVTYMIDNSYYGHYETASSPGFTGATPQVRAQYVGYSGSVGEVLSLVKTNAGGVTAIQSLSVSPYHLAEMLSPVTDAGMRYAPLNSTYDVFASDSGALTPAQYQNSPLTFPCQGITGAPYANTLGETPNPIINGQAVQFPIGTPVAIVGNASDTIALSSGTMTGPGGSAINLDLLDSATDGNHEIASFAAVAFPASPLQPNTTYNVSINGTDNGTPFSRNFSFTTGNTAY
nr:hypothetical protein [Acidithiobacillus sp.]